MFKFPTSFCFTVFLVLLLSSKLTIAQPKSLIFTHGDKPIAFLNFTNNGENLISADRAGEVKFWNAVNGKVVWSISFKRPKIAGDFTDIRINSLKISPDGKFAAIAYLRSGVDRNIIDRNLGDMRKQRDVVYEPHIVLINLENGKIEQDISDKDKVFESVEFSSDGKFLFSKTQFLEVKSPKTTFYFKIIGIDRQSEQMSEIVELVGSTDKVVFSPNREYFAVTGYNLSSKKGILEIFNTSKKADHFTITQNTEQVPVAECSTDGKYIAIAGRTKDGINIDVWDVEKQVLVNQFSEKNKISATGIVFLNIDFLAVSAGKFEFLGESALDIRLIDKGGYLYVFSVNSKKPIKYKFKSIVTNFDYSSYKKQIAVGMNNGKIEIIKIQ